MENIFLNLSVKMKELKKMIIDILCSEYTIEDATEQVNDAEIIIKNETVKVVYKNGKSDLFKLVVSERLELVSGHALTIPDVRGSALIKWLENQRRIAIESKAPSGECELLFDVIEKVKEIMFWAEADEYMRDKYYQKK